MIITSEEQADEAYFDQLESDLEWYYGQIDAQHEEDERQWAYEDEQERDLRERLRDEFGLQTVLTARLRHNPHNNTYKVVTYPEENFAEFKSWLLCTKRWDNSKEFINFEGNLMSYKQNDSIDGILASDHFYEIITPMPGILLHVTFSEYFDGWLSNRIKDEKSRIETESKNALRGLGLTGDPSLSPLPK